MSLALGGRHMNVFSNIHELVSYVLHRILFYIFGVLPIKKNKIVCSNFNGRGYGDSPKYICNELFKRKRNYDIVWVIGSDDLQLPIGIRTVRYGSLKFIYEMSTAKVWIDNCRKPYYVKKRHNQYYIQTWHGDMGIKKAEGDANNLDKKYEKKARRDSQHADLFITGTEWAAKRYQEAHFYKGEVAKCGLPRRDILYSEDQELRKSIKRRLNISEDEKILIYAPTFRDTMNKSVLKCYELDWEKILKTLSSRFGGKWRGLIRLHPNIINAATKLTFPETVIDVTNYPDMQELLFVSDCCISDYSSSLLEFAITGKVGFIFATDYKEYKNIRDVHFSLDFTPFPISENNDEMIHNIACFDRNEYNIKLHRFYGDYFGVLDAKNASEYVVDVLEKICI